MKRITSHSEQGQRIHAFLCKELGIPPDCTSVKVEYGVNTLFSVTVGFHATTSEQDAIPINTPGDFAKHFRVKDLRNE